MSRSGYSDDYDYSGLWRSTVHRALTGKRGQAFLREMAAALDEMPEKKLARGVLVEDGCVCAMGAVALRRGLDVSDVDETERDEVAELFNIAPAMAAEIAFENDEEGSGQETDEQRWQRMRAWVASYIRPAPEPPAEAP